MSQSGPALGRFPLTGDPRVTWEKLSNLLGSHWDEEQRVEVLGLKYAGSNVYDLRFRASRACRFVRVHVQSNVTGGRDYDAATSIGSVQVDMRTDRQAEVEITVNGTDDYYVFLVPEFEYEPGSYQRYDGVSGPDHMAYVDILAPAGLTVNPGADVDVDLITVVVTGTPKLAWRESDDRFLLTHGLTSGKLDIDDDDTEVTDPFGAITMRASGIDTGSPSFFPPSDAYCWMGQVQSGGGLLIQSIQEDDASATTLKLQAFGGVAQSTKTSAGVGLIALEAYEHDGAGALSDVAANGNVLSVGAQVGGGGRTLFIVDEDGDYFYDGADGGAFDSYDDTALARALSRAISPKDVIRSRWDEFVRYREADLVAAGVLGDTVANGGLVNGAQVQRLLIGAVWQLQQQINDMRAERSIFGRIGNAIGGIRRLLR